MARRSLTLTEIGHVQTVTFGLDTNTLRALYVQGEGRVALTVSPAGSGSDPDTSNVSTDDNTRWMPPVVGSFQTFVETAPSGGAWEVRAQLVGPSHSAVVIELDEVS